MGTGDYAVPRMSRLDGSPHQQLSESREVGLLVPRAAIAKRHGSKDEPDPTPPARDGSDGRDGVEPTRLTS